jgi:CheY-like chemotaxis protein
MASTEFRKRIPAKRILVVEDEIVAAQTIQTVLTVDGHSVDLAQDGQQGLAMFQAGQYDLVITDFKLGTTMDGLELAAAIKQDSPTTPIVLVTAYAAKMEGMGKVSNVELVMKKPFSVADLYETLLKLFPVS